MLTFARFFLFLHKADSVVQVLAKIGREFCNENIQRIFREYYTSASRVKNSVRIKRVPENSNDYGRVQVDAGV